MSLIESISPSGVILHEKEPDLQEFNRDLKQLDDRLFVAKELNQRYDCWEYIVFLWVSNDKPPVPICHHTDGAGRPLPLSSSLIERVRASEGGADRDMVAMTQRMNEEVKAQRRAENLADITERLEWSIPRMQGKISPAFHRGVHLRQSRDRTQRQRGRGDS